MRRALAASLGGIAAALLGSLCSAGPFLFVTLGVGAGLASAFEPLRPLFGVVMAAALGVGFYTVYGRRPAAAEAPAGDRAPGASCAVPRRRSRDKVLLWVAAVIALILWTFPSWSTLFV